MKLFKHKNDFYIHTQNGLRPIKINRKGFILNYSSVPSEAKEIKSLKVKLTPLSNYHEIDSGLFLSEDKTLYTKDYVANRHENKVGKKLLILIRIKKKSIHIRDLNEIEDLKSHKCKYITFQKNN